MKYITIFFDFEGKWGMPHEASYDLETSVSKILKVLKKHKAIAVFNTCGTIFESHSKVIEQIIKNGHEIALQGYKHENFCKLTANEIESVIDKSIRAFKKVSTATIRGIRIPYLMAPKFYDKSVYDIFAKKGFVWTSNREIRYVEEIFRPDRVKNNVLIRLLRITPFVDTLAARKLLHGIINYRLLFDRNAKELLSKATPYLLDGLVEIPIHSFLDCDMLGLPLPSEKTDNKLIDYTFNSMTTEFDASGKFFNLNYHDWIMGTSNRVGLLERMIGFVAHSSNVKFVTGSQVVSLLKHRK